MFGKLTSSSNERDTLAVVFDIGSSSVSGALFWMRKSGVPKIVFSVREVIAPQNKISVEDFLSQTVKALHTVAGAIAQSGAGAPEKIFCVLSSPWYVSQNRLVRMEKTIPFVFTSKLADSLIAQEIKLFEEEHLAKYVESGNKVRAIELKNIKTMLNGYEVADPLNQKAKSLEMVFFVSMSGEDILSRVEEVAMKHFHKRQVKFCSFLMASFTVVRDMYLHQEDFLLVDIGGEVTDISMVKKNMLRESVSYPMGRNFIVRNIAEFLNINFDEAKSIFSLYKDGHAEQKVKEEIEPVISSSKSEWLKKFQASLANLSNDISVPATIFITIEKEFADFFSDIIKTEQFNQYTLTESKFQVIFLNTERLHGIAIFEEDAIRDTFLIINAIYINRFFNQK